ncbi:MULTISPECIES: pyrimidine reductase family protein [Mycobacteriaceae]|uniref:Pyrimidine reductase family protein n=1 Tax=Mycolicibacterium parafortuitum TaxID=39692 RepID=A0ACC6MFQ8_MYCPF|nr:MULTISPECIES: pyrimidine reductase family protein [Mycobacteriaceae]MDZ5085723.1 pyrimidine reductase family protein [Mycolicibacterium parafortuitum]GFM17467.1 pyrimidine reductase [Mycobacterium sp. PO1]GFM23094.1 pyrimidine reductase [Mycobacterium sp. PO2]
MTNLATVAPGTAVEDYGYRPAPVGVRANMIFSADGAAGFAGHAGPLSCAADQQLLLALRAYADVVLVGAGTARAETYGPVKLSDDHRRQRVELGLGSEPPPLAVVSQSGRLPATMLGSSPPPILLTSARAAHAERVAELPCEVMVCGEDSVNITDAVAQLRSRGDGRVLCEGGPTLLDELVAADLVDQLCVTMAPVLAGCQPLGQAAAPMASPTRLQLEQTLVDDAGYVFLRYGRP